MLTQVPGQAVTTASALTTFARPSMTPGPSAMTTSIKKIQATTSSPAGYDDSAQSSLIENLSAQVSKASSAAKADASKAAAASSQEPKVQVASGADRSAVGGAALVAAVVLAAGVVAW